ncbi:hypothetical protein [Shewanella aestuarii]|uniref:Uncharacterized protein n=1 Tax=Shewanella aestuarii TaxID=1028752 RepID=A0A6G9QLI7_9GAMM|nr:hypothetical protein [Shewanella aestuarii]QIR15406.1 hypothetical protein HBH39_13620 [Shewanella aestuarii]
MAVALVTMIAFMAITAFYWKIAKDEIFYLCSNFSFGVTQASVIRQLNTADLSHYTHTLNESGSIIVLSSQLYFVTNQCTIELDKHEKVVFAAYQ